MITKILLGTLYWFGGFILAFLGAVGLGLALCAFVGLFNVFRYKRTWALALGYSVGSFICVLLIQGILFLAGTIGDRTGYNMQTMILLGLAFPGILMLAVIPPFIKVALRQTRGLPIEPTTYLR
mgnify:CR=1 FL=1